MDEAAKRSLAQAGVDVDEALERFMGNESLMLKFLLRFPADENFSRLRQAMAAGDAAGAFAAAHTLKGVAGNLSLKGLYQPLYPLVEDLRGGNLAAAAEKMPALEAAYTQITDLLAQLA